MNRKLSVVVVWVVILLFIRSVCLAEETPYYEVVLDSYIYDGNCSQVSSLSMPLPVPTPSPTPPSGIGWVYEPSRLSILENTLSKYGMNGEQRKKYLANMDHYSLYVLIGTQRIVGDGCVYIPICTTLNFPEDVWIREDFYRISTTEDDKEGEGEWPIHFSMIVKTEGRSDEQIEEMLNDLQIQVSFVTERHMEYDEIYDVEFETYNEASRTSVMAKINPEGLVRDWALEEQRNAPVDLESLITVEYYD